AGGIRAANYLAEQAPRDGTVMTTFAGGPILEPLIGARNPGYGVRRLGWIGAITKDIGLCISWGPTPFKTIDDVKKQQMIVAGTGAGSETDTWPVVLNDVLGTKFKLVTGCGQPGNDLGDRARGGSRPLRVQPIRAQDRQARLAARQKNQRPRSHRARKERGVSRRAGGGRSRHQAGGPPAALAHGRTFGHGAAIRGAARRVRR